MFLEMKCVGSMCGVTMMAKMKAEQVGCIVVSIKNMNDLMDRNVLKCLDILSVRVRYG